MTFDEEALSVLLMEVFLKLSNLNLKPLLNEFVSKPTLLKE